MWQPKRDLLQHDRLITVTFGKTTSFTRRSSVRYHGFAAFRAAFPDIELFYNPQMPIVNVINCKKEGYTKAYLFAPSMFSESSIAGNMVVYKDLVINQMGFDKSDEGFAEDLTLWWGDLKTDVQMISMQGQGIGMDWPYDRYQQILPGLALWHLRFKFLKIV